MWIYMIVINITMVVILIVAISFMYFYIILGPCLSNKKTEPLNNSIVRNF